MGEYHDAEATYFGDFILKEIRADNPNFKQIFSSEISRTADWDWPRPDYVCYDEKNNFTYALEFKPPYQNKREYLCGLGQSLSYLQKHAYSGLIVPFKADDGFAIADFISETLNSPEFSSVSTSLFGYDIDSHSIRLLRPITSLRSNLPKKPVSNDQTFWCFWRDMSHYELFDLLDASFKYSNVDGDIYTKLIYPEFYQRLINRDTKKWDGTPRNKTDTPESRKAEKQNYKIPLERMGLWTASEGRLTDLGYRLYEIGKKYGPDSQIFKSKLAYLILVNGKHLDLIHLVDKYQKLTSIPSKSSTYSKELEEYLEAHGYIGKRKPGAVTTGAKNSFIRDEPKLWNKLGLVEAKNNRIFVAEKGYSFNWDRITDILVNGRLE